MIISTVGRLDAQGVTSATPSVKVGTGGQNFLQALNGAAISMATSAAEAFTGTVPPPPNWADLEAMERSMERSMEIMKKAGDCGGKAGLTLRKMLEAIERQMGSPITETVVLQRDASGKFSVKSGTYGADGSYHGEVGSRPHPQKEMLEAILNGTDKKHPQLVAEVKAMLGEVDALYEESIGYEKELAALQGKDPPPYNTALDKWLALGDCHMCIPMKTAQAGRGLAKSHQAEFDRFKSEVSGAGLTEDQVYSRFFAQYATHDQLMAAVEHAQAEQDALA